jgi:uncharacterized protein (TIGR02444 family)
MINNPFWKYSLKRYAQAPIAQMCLQWQNEFHSNTNLVLLGDWLGSQCIVLSKQQWQALNEFILPWHNEVVLPLRGVRTALKSTVSNKHIYQLRDSIKEQELLAEQISQSRLYEYCQKHIAIKSTQAEHIPSAKECINKNITMYLQICCGVKKIDEQQRAVF